MSSYDHYVRDETFLSDYNAYQAKYATQIPERDKVTLKLIAKLTGGKPARLLDVGCSTGNLLMQIGRFFPNLELSGGDLAESSIEVARKNPELAGAKIDKIDMLDIKIKGFDIIISNAVTYLFDDVEFSKCCASVRSALNKGGTWIDFDWFSPFGNQRYTVNEVTESHPEGLNIHVRPYGMAARIMKESGFDTVDFQPFEIPIDLPLVDNPNPITHTVMGQDGKRMQFRGAVYQPWCHMSAKK